MKNLLWSDCERKQVEYLETQLFFEIFGDSVANWIFSENGHSLKIKSQLGTFHEVLPGNLEFVNFYYTGTIEIEYLNHTTKMNWKKYISTENFKSGIQNLS